ncbi:MAG: signal peptidase [Thermoleophilales bacterium]|nr:signal peptidase [Thermoleophilales bacterium]
MTTSLALGLVVAAALAYAGLFLFGYAPVVVYSGSMEPRIAVGSLAVTKPIPARNIKVGDVITFADPYVAHKLVTHRVVRIVKRPNRALAYRTKGDANAVRDPWLVELPNDVGQFKFAVPFVGYGLVYARTREARMLVILLIAALALVPLLRAIWRSPKAPQAVEQT